MTRRTRPPAAPLWLPFNKVIRQWWARLQDPNLTLEEFHRALREGRLVGQLREEGKLPCALPPTYWETTRLAFDLEGEDPTVVLVIQGDTPQQGRFYFWEPPVEEGADENILRDPADTTARPGPKPEHHWPKHVAREVARRVLAGERMPTAPEMLDFCSLKWNWRPDERQMQRVLRDLLVYFD
jgi:hypothetical protein